MNNRFVFLIVTCAWALMLPSAIHPQQVYGDIVAEDVAQSNVSLHGCNPPGPCRPGMQSLGWRWVDPCPDPSSGTPRADCMDDSGEALQNAINAVPLYGTLRFRYCRYRTDRTLTVDRPITIQFTSSEDRVTGCGIAVKAGIVGMRINGPITSDSSTIRGLRLHAYSRQGLPDSTAHGILVEHTAHLAGVTVEYFEGDGIHIEASSNRPTGGNNANAWKIDGGAALGNKGIGLLVRGYDANAGVAVRFDSIGNGVANYVDSSFLGNTYIACHSDRSSNGPGTPEVPTESYESGWSHASTPPQRIPSSRSLYLNCYEETGQTAKLGINSIWLGGEGEEVLIEGQASVLKTDNAGFWANHFTAGFATPTLKPVARIGPNGDVDSNGQFTDTSMAQFWLPTTSTMYVYPSTYSPGNIDVAYSTSAAKESRALSLSTGSARPFMEAPTGARLGRVLVVHAGSEPHTACNLGDLAINVSTDLALPKKPWAWQCIDTQGTWRALIFAP